MSLKEQFTGAIESVFLAATVAWTIVVGFAVVSPQPVREQQGTVEIYALASLNEVGT